LYDRSVVVSALHGPKNEEESSDSMQGSLRGWIHTTPHFCCALALGLLARVDADHAAAVAGPSAGGEDGGEVCSSCDETAGCSATERLASEMGHYARELSDCLLDPSGEFRDGEGLLARDAEELHFVGGGEKIPPSVHPMPQGLDGRGSGDLHEIGLSALLL
jgi:hypothetical protein